MDAVAATDALRERLVKLGDQADESAVLDPGMLGLACTALSAACTPGLAAADSAASIREVAWLRLFRSAVFSGGLEPDHRRADAEKEIALWLFIVLHWIQPELVPPNMAVGVKGLTEAGLGRTEAQRARLLADALLDVARSVGDLGGIDRSAGLYRQALRSGELADMAAVLFNLSQALIARFDLSQELSDLDEALTAVREAEQELKPGEPSRADALQNLAQLLEIRFERIRDRGNLDESIQAWQRSLEGSQPADPGRVSRLTGLSVALRMRHEQSGDSAELDKSIAIARQAVVVATEVSARVSNAMSALAAALSERYHATGDRRDLDEAIGLYRTAVARADPGDRDQAIFLNNLGLALRLRFQRNGQRSDLEDGITAIRTALGAFPEDDRGEYRSSLAMVLLDRYELGGNLTDLNEAVRAARDAGARPDVRQAEQLSNLGLILRIRYEQTHELADIDAAVEAGRAAVAAAMHTRDRARYLSVLSCSLAEHFKWTVDTRDLDEAIAVGSQAVTLCPADHPDRPGVLSNLSRVLNIQAEMIGLWRPAPEHLDEAVASAREALTITALDDPARPHRLASLAEALSTRFAWNSDDSDAVEALLTAQAAVLLLPDGHPLRAGCLATLGRCLHYQTGLRDAVTDREMLGRAFTAWREGAEILSAPASKRLTCAIRWIQAAQNLGSAADAEDAYAAAVRILPLLAWRGADRATQEKQLFTWGNLGTDAAACAVKAGHHERAVELLEVGRTVLWTQLLQTRDEIDDLRAADPSLARRLDLIRASLDGPDTMEPAEGRLDPRLAVDRRVQAATEWDELLTEIRTTVPGFGSFLDILPFSRLSAAAARGPVVIINVSQYRCDALAVTPSGVRVIRLPELTLTDAEQHAAALREALSQTGEGASESTDAALSWLWRTVTGPILRSLGLLREDPDREDSRPLPRIWWCPTGPLIHLPLHAAAPSPESPGAMDHVISSYAPTLRTLLRATSVTPDHGAREERLLLVTVPETSVLRGPILYGVDAEFRYIDRSFRGERTRYDGPAATTEAVIEAMAGHDHVHVACHGTVNLEQPAESGLWLHDGVLTIGALSRLQRRPSGLAFLSACHTAAGSARLPDETITMAMAMHAAGFTHVVATLWYIVDNLSPDVARRVYDALATPDGRLTLDDTSRALHAAARSLRNAGFPATRWAPYVHSGP